MNRRLYISVLIAGIISMLVFVLVISLVSAGGNGGSDSGTNWIPFIPIWFAAIVPILVQKRENDAQHEKAKRRLMCGDRYKMMNNLVDDLSKDELKYLYRRLNDMPDQRRLSQ